MLGSGLLIASLGCSGLVGTDAELVSPPAAGTELLVEIDLPDQVQHRLENDARKLQLLLGSDLAVVFEGGRRLRVQSALLDRRIRPTILDDYDEGDPIEWEGRTWRVFDASEALVTAVEEHTIERVSGVLGARLGAMGLTAWSVERSDASGALRVRVGSEVDLELVRAVLTTPGQLAVLIADPEFPEERVANLLERARAELTVELRDKREEMNDRLRDDGSIPPSHVVVWEPEPAGGPPRAYLALSQPMATDLDVVATEVRQDPAREIGAQAVIGIELDERAARRLAEGSRISLGGRLLVVVDGDVRTSSDIERPFEGSWTELSIGEGPDAAREAVVLAAVLQGGPLDVPLAIASASEF